MKPDGEIQHGSLSGLLEDAVDSVSRRFNEVQRRFKVSHAEIWEFLRSDRHDLFEQIIMLEDSIDSSVLGKERAGMLAGAERDGWERGVHEWRHFMHEALNVYEEVFALSHVA